MTRPRFRVWTLHQLASVQPPPWRIEHVLPAQGIAMLYGQPGSGKTFLAADIALTLAAGLPSWHGRAVKPARVAYCATESPAGFAARVRAWCAAHYTEPTDTFVVVPDAVQLLELGDAAGFLKAVEEAAGWTPEVIVLDTLSRCSPGARENNPEDASRVVASLDYLRDRTEGLVTALHHTRKDDDVERGSSVYRAACDTMIRVTNEEGERVAVLTKQRDGEEGDVLRFRLAAEVGSCIVQPVEASGGVRLDAAIRRALAALDAIATEDGAAAKAWMLTAQVPERSFHRLARKLEDAGLVSRVRHGHYGLTLAGRTEARRAAA